MIESASEFGTVASDAAADASAGADPSDTAHLSAGQMLRHAREYHDLPIEAVATALKVPVAKLEALEDDAIERLPDLAFARALAASVCRALRVDPAPVLAKMPGSQPVRLAQTDRAMSTGFRAQPTRPNRGRKRGMSRPLLIVVGLLLAAALALFMLPQSLLDKFSAKLDGSKPTETVTATQVGDAGSVVEPVPPKGTPPTTAMGSASGAISSGTSGMGGSAASSPASTPSASAASPQSGAAAPATNGAVTANPVVASTTPPAGGMAGALSAPLPVATAPGALTPGVNPLEFKAKVDSWVSVTDQRGTVLFKRLVKAGEAVGVSGALPLSVVVGRADGMEVDVRGQPFDLKSVTKPGGVARFEVKP